MIVDIIGRPIEVGDYVVFTNNIYVVKSLAESGPLKIGNYGYVSIMLHSPSKTTKPVKKYSRDMCLINRDDVLIWLLKKKA